MRVRLFGSILLLLGTAFAHAEEIHWPQQLDADNGAVVVIFQPQIETFSGNSIEGRAAVSVRSDGIADVPVFGAVWFQAKIDTDRDTRTALIRNVDVSDVRFADASNEQKDSLATFIEDRIEGSSFEISVDQVLTDLETGDLQSAGAALRHEAPEIILSTEPALLVSIDGEPRLEKIAGSEYQRVVNTPFLIVRAGDDHYLYIGSNAWYRAVAVAGPWADASRVPADIRSLVEPAEDDDAKTDGLRIIVATTPTELVVSDGPPSWAPVEGMGLLYMDNTDSNAFLELSTQRYYVLLSGRWYRSEGLEGDLQWAHVPNDQLPEPFSDIPEDSVNGDVLSQVAGTVQAREAVLDNTIPQTAAIQRDDDSFSVEYDGKPEFSPIEDVKVEYAQNTSAAVFRYGNDYFACDDGVWYQSASATGPWKVATNVPEAIYDIPASNPHHNVTYVKVYDVTPEVVYVGYTPGYYGSYYYRGTVIYGTGWYYNPWYGPYYYPRYPTWGFHVHYNPWYGWGVGVSWTNGPFRFTFSSRGAWWGVGGYRPYPRPVPYGGYRKTNININNTININGGRNRPQTRPNLYNRPQNAKRNAQRPVVPSDRRARPATNVQNNVLTDRSGNVYQREKNGSWKQRDSGQWKPPQNLDRAAPSTRPSQLPSSRPSQLPSSRPSQFPSSRPAQPAVRPQLERDFNARQQGMRRSQGFQQNRGGGRRR